MSIRKATVDDALDIKALIASLSHFYLDNKDAAIPEWFLRTLDASEFERRLSNDWFTHFVYVEESEIVGYLAMRGGCHLFHLFVAETHQRKGISKALWRHATSGAKPKEYTLRSSLYAVPVYQRFGFTEYGAVERKEGLVFQTMRKTL